MRESKIEKELRKQVEDIGGECWKWVSPGRRAVPDRIVLLPMQRIYFIELKAPGEEPTALQNVIHRILKRLGFDVRVIDSLEGVERFIDEVISFCGKHT